MPPVVWYSLQLKQIIKDTNTTWRFLFDLQADDLFNFIPGQFLTCDLPTGEKRAQRWRSYSIANANQKNNEIEFCISYKKEGLASEYFFNQIKIGDTFKCKGPEGNFILQTENVSHLFMICTGTGLAPFRSMLQDLQTAGHNFQSVDLIFGTRKHEDIIYRNDISDWNDQLKNFQSHICLSREDPLLDSLSLKSKFHHGYVHEVYKQILKTDSYSTKTCQFMICGWSEMIDQAVLTLFSELGFGRDQIRFELYG